MMHLSTAVKVEKLINYLVVDREEELSSVLVLLEPLPDAAAFDAARERLRGMKGSATLCQVWLLAVFHSVGVCYLAKQRFCTDQQIHYILTLCHKSVQIGR